MAVFLGLPLLIYLGLVIYPFIQAVHYSFTNWRGFSPISQASYIGFDNYAYILTSDTRFLTAMGNNIKMAIFLPLVTIILSLVLAIVIVIILLVISTAVAVIAPQPASRDEDRANPGNTVPAAATEDPGWRDEQDVLEVNVDLDSSGSGNPRHIEIKPGDHVRLRVAGPTGQQISIPDLGLIDTASRTAPAHFDLLLNQPGRYEIRSSIAREPVAIIIAGAD